MCTEDFRPFGGIMRGTSKVLENFDLSVDERRKMVYSLNGNIPLVLLKAPLLKSQEHRYDLAEFDTNHLSDE